MVVAKSSAAIFSVNFDHNLWKVQTTPANITTNARLINNQPPQFDSINVVKKLLQFSVKSILHLLLIKEPTAGVTIDLDGKPRPVGIQPDLGCFEKQ